MLTARLSQELGPSIEIVSIGNIRLNVSTAQSRKDAVGADVDEPRTRSLADLGQTVGKQGVDLQAFDRLVRFGALLDDADRVDHGLRAARRDDFLQLPGRAYVYPEIGLGPVEQVQRLVVARIA